MDLDGNLARLARLPVPDMSRIDANALARRARAERRQSQVTLSLALVMALGIGIAGGLQTPRAEDAPRIAFGPSPALTPLIGLGQE